MAALVATGLKRRADAAHKTLASSATRLFAVPGVIPEWGVTPDGSRFLFIVMHLL